MASVSSAGLSRVTLVAPRGRVDLALPSDVPLAELLPALVRYAGDEILDPSRARDGWVLTRLGNRVLDTSRTPAQLEVRDGELLYLRPRTPDAPDLVFDDVVDAVATATQERPGRWTVATTRWFGVVFGLTALVGGALGLLFAGPPQLPAGAAGIGLAVVLLVVAVVLARAVGDSRTGVAFALLAIGYAGVGGLLVFGGDRPLDQLAAPHVLVGAALVLVFTALAAVGVADEIPVFLGAGVCALALLLGSLLALLTGTGAAGAAAALVTVVFAAVPALPMLAYRMAGLPIPSVPSDPEELKRDAETVDASVLPLAERGDGLLTGMLGALAVIGAVAAILNVGAGYPGIGLAGLVGVLLLARARYFLGQRQRLPLLVAGAVALGAASVGLFTSVGPTLRLVAVVGGLVVVAAISVVYALIGAGRKISPVWGRTLDIVEVVLILGLVPLAVWVTGLYGWIRTIRG